MRAYLSVAVATIVTLLAPNSASATTGLQWKWEEGTPQRYLIHAQVVLPEVMLLQAVNNDRVRITEFQVNLNTLCASVATRGKHTWDVECKIDDIALRVVPIHSDRKRLKPLIDEMDTRLTGATIALVFADDGRVKSIDLKGVDSRNRRTVAMFEVMRVMLARTVAAFDLQLPRKGDDGGGGWNQRSSQIAQMPSSSGTMGMISLAHEAKGQGPEVTITSVGKGNIGTGGEQMLSQSQARPSNMYAVTINSTASFDTAAGHLLSRQYLVKGTPTASSLIAEGTAGVDYVQAARLTWVAPGATVPTFGDNEEVDSSKAGTTVNQ